MKPLIVFLLTIILCAFSAGYESYIPPGWPAPEYTFKENPLSKEKILLGRALFYDPILSRNNMISCASCHSQYNAFTHVDHELSHGIDDRIGTRNSPALMNLAWHRSFMWDGAVNHLDMQALAPISHPDEMGESISNVVNKLRSSKIYPSLFASAYGDPAITGERTLKAISQFLLTLVSSNSKYDRVMRKETEFSEQEEKGYMLFKKNCAGCHREPLFTTNEFSNNGLKPSPVLKDVGRMEITGRPEDSLKFKIPTLRNIEFTYPYMHDGRFKKISEVIEHYTAGIQDSKTLAGQLRKKIILSSNEKVDLVAFLLTLTDKEFLFDRKHSYPHTILTPQSKE